MKTQNNVVKSLILIGATILNTLGLGIFLPGLNALVEQIGAKKLKPVSYVTWVVIIGLVAIQFMGGITPQDKKTIEETLNEVKIDTAKVDTVKTIVIDSLKK